MFMEQFKRAQVIILPTEQYTNLCLGHNLSYVESKNSISIDAIWKSIELQYPYKPQHLYIITEDEIKEISQNNKDNNKKDDKNDIPPSMLALKGTDIENMVLANKTIVTQQYNKDEKE